MATYAKIRHLELDNVGQGKKRITKPPGGEASDIFGASPTTTPPSTPRKVKNHMASTIFTPAEAKPVPKPSPRHRPNEDSFKRLFGAQEVDGTPKKNLQKSSIIFQEAEKVNGHANGIANGHTNGVTVTVTDGVANGLANGHATITPVVVVTNGHTNGINGHSNGLNGHVNGFGGSTGSISCSSSGSNTPSNGSINGDYKSPSNGHTNGGMPVTPSRRIPPGGFSTKLW